MSRFTSVGVVMSDTKVVANYEFTHGLWKVAWATDISRVDIVCQGRAGYMTVDRSDVRSLVEALERFMSETGVEEGDGDVGDT